MNRMDPAATVVVIVLVLMAVIGLVEFLLDRFARERRMTQSLKAITAAIKENVQAG